MERFEHMGYWWLPGDPNVAITEMPETAIPGKLSFDPVVGGVLELFGNLEPLVPNGIDVRTRIQMLQGSVKGTFACVTLQGCHMQSVSPHRSSFVETKLVVDYIFIGRGYWFDSIEDIIFENLSVGYSYLDDWMYQDNFGIHSTRSDYRSIWGRNLYSVSPEHIELPLDNSKIELWAESGTSTTTMTDESMKDEYRITITPNEPMPLVEYLNIVNFHLPNFLTLATGHTNFPLHVSGVTANGFGAMRIFYKILGYADKARQISQWPMLFSFRDVKEDLPRYLLTWIRKADELEATYDLYFRAQYSKVLLFDSEFLNLAQALEAYHRNVYGGEYLSREEYEPIRVELVDAIPDCVDSSHKDALEGTLRYGNQYSLRTRLKRVFDKVLSEQSDDLRKLVGNPTNFIHRLVETRNYYTHRDGEPNAYVLNDNEVYRFTRKMRMLLQICFLKEMEFSPSEITRLLNLNQEYQRLTEDKSA